MATAIAELGSSTRIHRPAAFSARSYCFATVTVQADIRRVLQALMIPEYMEAWIEVPGAERIACVAEGSEPGSFRLEVYTADKRRALICGRHTLVTPNQLRSEWTRVVAGGSEESVLDIRLNKLRQACLLRLRHTQFGAGSSSPRDLPSWQSSLEKLARLLE
jgi:uncharacterized protein YndB with AHSA1/START domain